MKCSKPGLKVFIKTRIRHPFKNSYDLLYKDDSGAEYVDAGSVFPVMLTVLYLLLFLVIMLNLRLTVFGWILWLALPPLHRFVLRYFWTKFEVNENEFAQLKTDMLLIRKKPWKKPSSLKKAVVFLAAALVIAIAAGAYFITDNPSFKIMPEIKYIEVSRDIETAEQRYKYAQEIAEEQIPGAELLWYEIRVENDGLFCHFIFGNPNPGIFILSPKMIYISFYPNSSQAMWNDLYYDMAPKLERLKRIDFVPVPGEYPRIFS